MCLQDNKRTGNDVVQQEVSFWLNIHDVNMFSMFGRWASHKSVLDIEEEVCVRHTYIHATGERAFTLVTLICASLAAVNMIVAL